MEVERRQPESNSWLHQALPQRPVIAALTELKVNSKKVVVKVFFHAHKSKFADAKMALEGNQWAVCREMPLRMNVAGENTGAIYCNWEHKMALPIS